MDTKSQKNFLSRLADLITFVPYTEPGYVRTFPGVNISYKNKVVELIGKQDETLFHGEDVDCNWRKQNWVTKFYMIQ